MPESTLQPSDTDTWIDEVNATTNYGTDTTMKLSYDSGGDNGDLLIKFDLSSIAPGSTIQSATLTLHCVTQSGTGVNDVRIARLLKDWTEGGADWNTYDGSTSWGTAGAEGADDDIDSVTMFADTVSWSDATSESMSLSATEFQKLIDVNNYGFKVYGAQRSPSITRNTNIATSENGTAGNRPKLLVRWLEPAGRLIEYEFNSEDPLQRVLDSKGAVVNPNEVRPNNWLRVLGHDIPGAKSYVDLVEDPSVNYIVGTDYNDDEGTVDMKFDRNQFADRVIRQLSGGG